MFENLEVTSIYSVENPQYEEDLKHRNNAITGEQLSDFDRVVSASGLLLKMEK